MESAASTTTGNERSEEAEAEVAFATASAAALPAVPVTIVEFGAGDVFVFRPEHTCPVKK